MRTKENAVLDALQRAQRFLDENAPLLTGGVDLTAGRKRLDEVVKTFTAHAFDQDVGDRGAKGETAKQRQLHIKLRQEQMKPIAVVARGNLRNTPEFVALQMPKPTVRGQAFIASAHGMADAATIHKETFIAEGLPPTFIDDFQAAIAKFDGSLSDREKNRTRRVGATKGLDLEAKHGRRVLNVLDALVLQAVADKESLLRAWQAARLIRRSTANTTAPASTPDAAPPAAPAPATAVASTPTPLPVSESTPVAA